MARTRSTTNALRRVLASSPRPVYVLDEKRKIVYCNPACGQWMGRETQQLIDLRCDYHSQHEDGQQWGAGLCPPPEVFRGQPMSGTVWCRTDDGQLRERQGMFLPLSGEDLDFAGAVAILDVQDQVLDRRSPASPAEVVDAAQLHRQLVALRQEMGGRFDLSQLIGHSSAIGRVRDQIRLAVEGRPRILVVGPSGSGREHVARTIYYHQSPETFGSLVPLSCSLLDAELLQTTVAAFVKRYPEIELEQQASLMLLDIDELATDAQAALMGMMSIVEFEVHTIATSRNSLMELAAAGKFRPDLACRLSTLVIELPPLSERREDIPLLAQSVLEAWNAEGGSQLSGFTPEALDQLAAHPWQENVDELRRVVQDGCRRAAGPFITAIDLPQQIRIAAETVAHPRRRQEMIALDQYLEEIEAELIRRALHQAKGNKSQAARMLGINRPRLLRRISHFGLD